MALAEGNSGRSSRLMRRASSSNTGFKNLSSSKSDFEIVEETGRPPRSRFKLELQVDEACGVLLRTIQLRAL